MLDHHGIQRVKRDRIYVSRRRQAAKRPNHRVFLNEAEFAHALAEWGFRIIEPEILPFVEQMATFAAAAMVVGPSGSGMFNCIFCPRGATIVDIESAPFWLHAHTNLFASLGHDYGLILGDADQTDPNPGHKRWSLDLERALARIDSLL